MVSSCGSKTTQNYVTGKCPVYGTTFIGFDERDSLTVIALTLKMTIAGRQG
jgi:hypothetical protein